MHPLLLAAKRRAAAAAEAEREKAEKAATAAAEAEREKAAAAAAEREEAPAPASSPPAVASPEEDGACRVCGVDDDEGLLCDGCNACYHAKCLGLDTVPDGDWYCEACLEGASRFRSNPRRNRGAPRAAPFFMKPESASASHGRGRGGGSRGRSSARGALKAECTSKARDAARRGKKSPFLCHRHEGGGGEGCEGAQVRLPRARSESSNPNQRPRTRHAAGTRRARLGDDAR